MPVINKLATERRRAESQVAELRARIRLLHDTAVDNEKRARRDNKTKEIRQVVVDDALAHRDDVKNEMMRRRIIDEENKAAASEQRQLNRKNREFSRRLATDSRVAAARAVREKIAKQVETARDLHKNDWVHRTERARQARAEKEWFQRAKREHELEFSDRMRECRDMAVAEEETRIAVVQVKNEELQQELLEEEARLHEAQQNYAFSATEQQPQYQQDGGGTNSPTAVSSKRGSHHSLFAGAGGGSGAGVGYQRPGLAKLASYEIVGPAMATVRHGHRLVARVHFEMTPSSQTHASASLHHLQNRTRAGRFLSPASTTAATGANFSNLKSAKVIPGGAATKASASAMMRRNELDIIAAAANQHPRKHVTIEMLRRQQQDVDPLNRRTRSLIGTHGLN